MDRPAGAGAGRVRAAAVDPELVEEYGDPPVVLATVLPMAAPAVAKADGRVLIGLQRHQQSGDVSRDWPTRCSARCGPSRVVR